MREADSEVALSDECDDDYLLDIFKNDKALGPLPVEL